MATTINLKHQASGVIKKGYYGFSWTTLFFGFFPALFRADFLTFLGGFAISVILGSFTFGLGALCVQVIWAFLYNGYFTRKLLTQGYQILDQEPALTLARQKLGVAA